MKVTHFISDALSILRASAHKGGLKHRQQTSTEDFPHSLQTFISIINSVFSSLSSCSDLAPKCILGDLIASTWDHL